MVKPQDDTQKAGSAEITHFASQPQFLINDDDFALDWIHLVQVDGHGVANTVGRGAVIAAIALDGARRLAGQAFGVSRRSNVASPPDGALERWLDLVCSEHKIDLLMAKQGACNPVARTVDVDQLPCFRDGVDGCEKHIRRQGFDPFIEKILRITGTGIRYLIVF